MSDPWRYLAGILILFLMHALFAASETALRSVSRSRMTALAEEGDRKAARVLMNLERPASFLTAIQVVKTILTLSIPVVLLPLARALLDGASPKTGTLAGYAGPITVLGAIVLLLLFGEIVPKVIASQHSERVALMSARWIGLFTAVIYPLFKGIDRLSQVFVSRTNGSTAHSPLEAEEEIKMMAAGGVETGEIEPEEQEMIRGVLTATDMVAREVMVPRIDLTAVEVDGSLSDLLDAILTQGHSRIPIYEETIDRIIGIVHARDLLEALRRRDLDELRIRDLSLRIPHYIPENKRLLDLLNEMRQSKSPLAIVVDEYGGTSGLVTIEDLLEEIVGEIADESDRDEELWRRIDDRTVLFAGRAPVGDVNELMKSHLPDDDFDTIGGFMFGQAGQVPEEGYTVTVDDVILTVESTDRHRVRQVKAVRVDETEERTGGKADDRVPEKTDDRVSGKADGGIAERAGEKTAEKADVKDEARASEWTARNRE